MSEECPAKYVLAAMSPPQVVTIKQDNLFKAPSKVRLSVDSRADKMLEVDRGHLVQPPHPQKLGTLNSKNWNSVTGITLGSPTSDDSSVLSGRLTPADICYAAAVLDPFSAFLHLMLTLVARLLSILAIIKSTYAQETWCLVKLCVRLVLNYLNPLINFHFSFWRKFGCEEVGVPTWSPTSTVPEPSEPAPLVLLFHTLILTQ